MFTVLMALGVFVSAIIVELGSVQSCLHVCDCVCVSV